MRTIEAAFIFFISGSLLLQAMPPPPKNNAFLQQYVLANDIYLELYRELGTSIYRADSELQVKATLERISDETKLCIFYDNSHYQVKTCEIKEGAFIERQVLARAVRLGVGK